MTPIQIDETWDDDDLEFERRDNISLDNESQRMTDRYMKEIGAGFDDPDGYPQRHRARFTR